MPKAERALIITTLNQDHHKLKCTLTPAMWELYSHQMCQWNDNSTYLKQHQVTALSPTCCCRWLKCHWVCKEQWSHSLHHYSCYKFLFFFVLTGQHFPCVQVLTHHFHSLLPQHSSLLNTLHSPYLVFHSPLFVCTPAHFMTISDLISTFFASAPPSPNPTPHFQPCPVPTTLHTLYGRFTQLQTFATFHIFCGGFTRLQKFATFQKLHTFATF